MPEPKRSVRLAKQLRRQQTDAEAKLWSRLRRKQIGGFHFRHQVPLGPYIADFACKSACLVIELDGGQHADRQDEDAQRTQYLNSRGYRVLRFWNNEVFENLDGVVERILAALHPDDPG